MSDQPIEQPLKPYRHVPIAPLCRKVICMVVFLGIALLSTVAYSGELSQSDQQSLPLLVRARQGDTAASLAGRYLEDASKAWMIVEYNGMVTFSKGQAVIVPTAPSRLGGLRPEGYQIVPVLAYADIGGPSGSSASISLTAFEEQMSWLDNSGYTTITPAQLVAFMDLSAGLPRHAVLITADTESLAFFDQAVPILKSFGFTATLCVATENVGQSENMTWEHLRQLGQEGFCIGCRGQYGRSLPHAPNGQSLENQFNAIETELRQAKKTIEQQLGGTCAVLAYPQGDSNGLIAATAAKLGFSAAFVQSPGENPFFGNRFGIHRIVIDRPMQPDGFTRMLTTIVAAGLH